MPSRTQEPEARLPYGGAVRILDSLRSPAYRVYALAMLLFFSASQMQLMARNWYIYRLTGEPVMLGLLNLATGLPMLLFALFSGTLADRFPKRTLLLVGQAVMGGLAFLLALDIRMGWIAWWHLLALGFLQGLANAVVMPAHQALIPELVEPHRLLNAVSLSAAEVNLNRILAPVVCGFLIALWGVGSVFVAIGGLCLGAFAVTLFLPPTRPAGALAGRGAVLREVAEGVRYALGHRSLRAVLGASLAALMLGFPFQFLLPVFTEDILRVGPEGLGLLTGALGVGALAGSLVSASLGDFRRKGLLMLAFLLAFGLGMVAFSFARSFPVAMALTVPVGVGMVGRMALTNTLLQAYSDPGMRGRVSALSLAQLGLQPLGTLALGALAGALSAPLAVAGAGALLALFALWNLLRPSTLRSLA